MKAKLIEVFTSIQGEGKYAGDRQTFVRFFECNMHCHWCDTPHSIGDTTQNYREVPCEEILEEIQKSDPDCRAVSLTGGEPLLQAAVIKELAPLLHELDIQIHLETNGTLPEELSQVIHDVDVIAMDLKLPSSTKCRSFWQEHQKFLEIAVERDVFIKTVLTKETDKGEVLQAAQLAAKVDPGVLFILQPNTFDLGQGVMSFCQEMQKECSAYLTNVRILPQMHKLMKVR